MAEEKEASSKQGSKPDDLAGQIVEIDLSSLRQVRAPKRLKKKPRAPTIDLSRIQEDRVSRNKMFEDLGITVALVMQAQKENLGAVSYMTIGQGNARKVYAVPDCKTRQKAVETGLKLLSLIRGDENLAASRPVQINMVSDTREKVERLIGGPLALASGDIIDVQTQTPATAETNETEIADEPTGNGSFEPGDQPGSKSGVPIDLEGADRTEQAGDARGGPGDAAAGPVGREPIPGAAVRENIGGGAGEDESYDFSFD